MLKMAYWGFRNIYYTWILIIICAWGSYNCRKLKGITLPYSMEDSSRCCIISHLVFTHFPIVLHCHNIISFLGRKVAHVENNDLGWWLNANPNGRFVVRIFCMREYFIIEITCISFMLYKMQTCTSHTKGPLLWTIARSIQIQKVRVKVEPICMECQKDNWHKILINTRMGETFIPMIQMIKRL